jgi:hypothetical protein
MPGVVSRRRGRVSRSQDRWCCRVFVGEFAPPRDHGVVRGDGLTAGKALLVLAGVWTFGVLLLVGSLFGSAGVDHFRHAPSCSAGEVFTSAYCRITVNATVTGLTHEHVTVDVQGRQIDPEIYLHGSLPGNVAGLPVRVTFYQGVAVHIEGGDLNFDTAAAPVDHIDELRGAGLFFLVGGALIVGFNALIRLGRRADAG